MAEYRLERKKYEIQTTGQRCKTQTQRLETVGSIV